MGISARIPFVTPSRMQPDAVSHSAAVVVFESTRQLQPTVSSAYLVVARFVRFNIFGMFFPMHAYCDIVIIFLVVLYWNEWHWVSIIARRVHDGDSSHAFESLREP